jgi:hypothetical protein
MLGPVGFDRLSRRRLIQFGAGAYLGLNLGGLWRAQASETRIATSRPIRSCILVFLYGGPSHIDTFDPKPEAPVEVRGEFASIATTAPGVRVCEHLPGMAKVMHHVAQLRGMHHAAHLHDSGSIHMLTGRPLDGPDRELFAPIPQQFPSYGSAVSAYRNGDPVEVPFAALPYVFQNVVPTPCQGAGFLGAKYDPLLIDVNPGRREYEVDVLRPRTELGPDRRRSRQQLQVRLESDRGDNPLGVLQEEALRLLESEAIRTALDISRETPEVRARYGIGEDGLGAGEVNGGGGEVGFGRAMRGQNFLLARRLVEAGVPFINVYDYKQQGANWDAHVNCAHQHKRYLLPQFDQGLSALIEDLDQRGLLESTLIVVTGEFGRTPKINPVGGRDHWPECSTVLLAGGGVTGGAVYGSSDRMGAFPATNPVTPGDLAATIFARFGIDPTTEMHDRSGRPYPIAAGEPVAAVFG